MSRRTPAWLLETGAGVRVAIAEQQACEYLAQAPKIAVPLAPAYCRYLFFWRDEVLPLFDLTELAQEPIISAANAAGEPGVVVVAYQIKPRTPLQYAGIAVCKAPSRIMVDDVQVSEFPAQYPEQLRVVASSCFQHQSQPAVVLALERMITSDFREVVERAKGGAERRHA